MHIYIFMYIYIFKDGLQPKIKMFKSVGKNYKIYILRLVYKIQYTINSKILLYNSPH